MSAQRKRSARDERGTNASNLASRDRYQRERKYDVTLLKVLREALDLMIRELREGDPKAPAEQHVLDQILWPLYRELGIRHTPFEVWRPDPYKPIKRETALRNAELRRIKIQDLRFKADQKPSDRASGISPHLLPGPGPGKGGEL